MRVAIIGAGAAGLCSARHCREIARVTDIVIFEQSSQLGGVWVYNEASSFDEPKTPNHSAVYRNMRVNLPKEIMAFPDFPFNEKLRSFVTHRHVLSYLHEYAKRFELMQNIRFKTKVLQVQRDENNKWKIETMSGDNGDTNIDYFDALFVCNGHYSVERIPEIDGYKTFTGRSMHSRAYAHPEPYAGLRIACLGAGPSGLDISLELSTVASQVYLCHNKARRNCPLPANLEQRALFLSFEGADIVLVDGSRLSNIDLVIYCTGYEYQFPFFLNDGRSPPPVELRNNRIYPLYKHIAHADYPTDLFFIGLCILTVPFPFFDFQAQFACSMLSGRCKPPSRDRMMQWIEGDYRMKLVDMKLTPKHAHYIGPTQWHFMSELAQEGNFENRLKPAVIQLYNHLETYRQHALMTYKNDNYEIIDDYTFKRKKCHADKQECDRMLLQPEM
uniref:Flavin-containing monooxygenase n=1 Tax=Plectus sambesii TaxID=2011161 RepID=A0A914VKU5_9BILA